MNQILYFVLYYGHMILTIYFYLMIGAIVVSWTSLRTSKAYAILQQITDPYLNLFRGKLIGGSLDFGPMIGLLLYQFLLSYIERQLF
jgi:uncharacterized protein YggT (Ycf19 family)